MQGIYAIICLPENKYYIGSSIDVKRRWREHRNELKKEIHKNSVLQMDWDCYGDESFNFIVLEDTNNLVEREHYYINKYTDNYNIVKNSWNPMREPEFVDKMMKTKREKGNKLTFRQKLTESDVIEIISRVNKGESDIVIAKDYGVLRGSIWSIKTGNTWKHLHHLVKPQKSYTEKRQEIIQKGIKMLKEGQDIDKICEELDRKRSTVLLWQKSL